DPDFVDSIFANRAVLWAARLLLVSAVGVLGLGGIFIAASIGIRMKNGEWLRRAGPFEISQVELDKATGEAEFWHRAALANQKEIVDLESRLRQSARLIDEMRRRAL
ncbi:MAG TPA: hypothetical protein VN733_05685, partial [Solirubrobacterales bacterium]|nr:hypothetical protein [Solirubrobacterales bacterium]